MTVQNRAPVKMTQDATTEAVRILNELGQIANDAPIQVNTQLSALRGRLKWLVNEIEGRPHGSDWLIS